MSGLKSRLTAALAASWEGERLAILSLETLAETAPLALRPRLLGLASGCQAHASRLLARMAALGGGPLPVPPDEVELSPELKDALMGEATRARHLADRYGSIAILARSTLDPSAAWVCELNRAEELERATELAGIAYGLREESERILPP